MDWLDDWLEGTLGAAAAAEPADRLRQERFLVSRLLCAATALASVPAFLALGAPTGSLDCLAAGALAGPLAAVAVLARGGSLAAAQAVVSAILSATLAAAVSPAPWALLVFAAVPLEAMFGGSVRGVLLSAAAALAGAAATVLPAAGGATAATSLVVLAPLAVALAAGHGLAGLALERRLRHLFAAAREAGEAREGATLDAIDDLVTWHGRDGSVSRASAAAARMLAVSAGSLRGRGLFDRIQVADRPAFLKAISDATTANGPIVVPLRLRSESGEGMASVEMRVHRLSGHGEDAKLVAVCRDVVAHERRADSLEARLREIEAQAAADRRVLATAAVELHAPLEAIVAYADLLVSGRGSGGEYPTLIRQTGRHLHGVVSSLLDLQAIERGQAELAPEPFAASELVAEACDAFAAPAARSGVEIVRDFSADLQPALGDRRACRAILDTLLRNAVAFTPRGGRVTVAAHRDGGMLLVSVHDTGLGVAPRDLSRLGEPFFRAATAGGGSSKGLGLALARGLAALQGGKISLASTPGDGFCASFRLPLDRGPVARTAETKPAPVRSATRFRSGDLHRMTLRA